MSDTAIEATGLEKRYGETKALDGVSFDVPAGAIFGLLGPNGAGKTTLTRLLTGSARPTGGQVRVLGHDPFLESARIRHLVGYMPQAPALYEDLTCRQNLEFFASAQPLEEPKTRIAEILDLVGLGDRASARAFSLSGGMKQRLSLACALLHRPQILLLDEPTAGVDLELREQFWQHFRALAANGATVVVSTHQMDEAVLCDQLAVLRAGKLVACETPERMLQRGGAKVVIRRAGVSEEHVVKHALAELPGVLRSYGLREDVSEIEIRQETLDQILLRMIGAERD